MPKGTRPDTGKASRKTTPPAYEPPKLIKFDKLEKLIVSGE